MKLRPYQETGVDWLRVRPRAILADDMGLGKTVTAIRAASKASRSRSAGTSLVVAPKSMLHGWERELRSWEGETDVCVAGTSADVAAALDAPPKWLILTYQLLWTVAATKEKTKSGNVRVVLSPEWRKRRWERVIYDEAHRLKNRKGRFHALAKGLSRQTGSLWLLTGTPIPNTGADLWSLLNLVNSKRWSSYWKFVDAFCEVEKGYFGWKVGFLRDAVGLKHAISDDLLRRRKEDVLPDLPLKTLVPVWVDLEPDHRKIYDGLEKAALAELEGVTLAPNHAIEKTVRLRQAAIDPLLAIPDYNGPLTGAKVDALFDLLDGIGDAQAVIFSQYKRAVRRLVPMLREAGYSVGVISGDVTGEKRQEFIDRFQDGDLDLMVGTTTAMGEGVTLTAAPYAVFLDKLWDPASNLQARDRVHRIGQTKPVVIYEILTTGTIEEDVEDSLEAKEFDIDVVLNRFAERAAIRRRTSQVRR